MHTDADDISRHDALRHNRLKGLVDKDGIARGLRCRRGKNKQPSRRNDSSTKGIVAGIYEMNTHWNSTLPGTITATSAWDFVVNVSVGYLSLLSRLPGSRNTGKESCRFASR